jgi:hypothetical protein
VDFGAQAAVTENAAATARALRVRRMGIGARGGK